MMLVFIGIGGSELKHLRTQASSRSQRVSGITPGSSLDSGTVLGWVARSTRARPFSLCQYLALPCGHFDGGVRIRWYWPYSSVARSMSSEALSLATLFFMLARG